jgi:hypothetical protein
VVDGFFRLLEDLGGSLRPGGGGQQHGEQHGG